MSEITICVKCQYHQNSGGHKGCKGNFDSPWVHLCTASSFPRKLDPVSGVEGFYSVNDLGTEYFIDQQYRYCRDVNDGCCSRFKAAGVA